ncbi:MAG: rubrerythrin family protein [Promethearchaeota archaeon]
MSNRDTILKEAITEEFNAIRKYKEYAKIADDEGFPNVAKLFHGLVECETIHLSNHKRVLASEFPPEVAGFTPGTTLENLKDALGAEMFEYKELYPRLLKGLKRAKTEDDEVAKLSLKWAMETEKNHATHLNSAIALLEQGKDYDKDTFWVCEVCGNLHVGDQPNDICPVCKHDFAFFKEVSM